MEFGETGEVKFDKDTDKLCLSFANTADWHASGQPVEGLKHYWDLLNWGVVVGLIDREFAQQLAKIADGTPELAERVLQDGIELREAIYRIFSSVANQRNVNLEDIQILNRAMRNAYPFLQISRSNDEFKLVWQENTKVLDQILWPIIHSAVELLTSEGLDRVGQCDDDRGCGWLFYDTSRNKSRRWCSMETCGNRAKAKRHFEKQRIAR
jgi:predicted RNA-binding Zn ribbon-like protein